MRLDLSAPHQKYHAADGRLLTGVTTYCGVLDKPPLHPWACGEERKGIMALADGLASEDGYLQIQSLRRNLPVDPKTGKAVYYADVRTARAASLGTVTHARCEAYNKGDVLEPDGIPPDLYALSVHGFERYKEFLAKNKLRVVKAEDQFVYEGEGMAYGGTRDIELEDEWGCLVLGDLKTSKASAYWPYDETFAQTSAYARPKWDAYKRSVVIRLGTTEDDALQERWVSFDERLAGWELFCGAYRSFEAKKALNRAKKEGVK